METPLAAAIRQILSVSEVTVFDYRESFANLWSEGLNADNSQIAGQQAIVIVGVAPPEQDKSLKCLETINFSDHLTALSWAAAWRVKFPSAKTRIAILDYEGGLPSGSTSAALALLLSARHTDGSFLVPGLAFFDSPSLAAMLAWMRRPIQLQANTSASDALLRNTIWEGLTANRDIHHAISNVLGAFLLGMQRGHGKQNSMQQCLFGLLQALSLTKKADTQGPWVPAKQRTAIEGAILMDDMADIWDGFLRSALGFEGDDLRRLVTSPKDGFQETISGLPQRLSRFLSSGAVRLDARILIPGKHALRENFVLFLDLRLFPQSDDATPFLRAISVFGLKLLDSERNLPWLDSDSANRKALRNELEYWTSAKTPAPAPTLPAPETLLPRLLSLVDPTLPIIIFSSTHRTELIDPFREYGNIITKFRKPILSGIASAWFEVAKELHGDFVSAMEQATRVQNTRELFQALA